MTPQTSVRHAANATHAASCSRVFMVILQIAVCGASFLQSALPRRLAPPC
jgi:hypothetical protein